MQWILVQLESPPALQRRYGWQASLRSQVINPQTLRHITRPRPIPPSSLTTVSQYACAASGAKPDNMLGTSTVRAGWSTDRAPRLALPPLMAKYKDRRINRYYMFSGSDVFADGTSRGQSKNVYEPGTNIINNWDCMEGVLDYVFIKLGLGNHDGGIGRPVVMTEPVANLEYSRKSQCISSDSSSPRAD